MLYPDATEGSVIVLVGVNVSDLENLLLLSSNVKGKLGYFHV